MSKLRRPTRSFLIASALVIVAGCSGAGGLASGGPSTAPSPAASGRPERDARRGCHRPSDGRDRRDPPIRGGRWLHQSVVPARPDPDVHLVWRRHHRVPQSGAGGAAGRGLDRNDEPRADGQARARSRSRRCSSYALGEGGLGAARLKYDNNMVADAVDRHLHDRCRRSPKDRCRSTPSGWTSRVWPTARPAPVRQARPAAQRLRQRRNDPD